MTDPAYLVLLLAAVLALYSAVLWILASQCRDRFWRGELERLEARFREAWRRLPKDLRRAAMKPIEGGRNGAA